MVQTNQDDTFYASNVHVLEFTLTDSDSSSALNLTGCLVRWAVSALEMDGSYSTTAVLNKDSSAVGGVVIVNATGGIVRVEIEPEDTEELAGRYYHELEVLDVSGNPVVVATGYLTINPNVVNA